MTAEIAEILKEKDHKISIIIFCTEEFNQNWLQTEKNGREKFDLIAKIENQGISIKILTMRLKVSRRRSQRCRSSKSMLVFHKKL